jgi:tellurite resistance protein TehA-like permease
MSEPYRTPAGPPRYTGGQIALILFGVIFLLPGLCSLLVMVSMVPWNMNDPFFSLAATIWIICLLISAGGVAMIYAARKRAKAAR